MVEDPYKYFRIEARELLEALSQGVLELERGAPGKELVGRLLRFAHTLKGAARVVKQAAIADLAHAAEDVLAPYREGGGPVPPQQTGELLQLLDRIRVGLASLGSAREPSHDGDPTPPAADERFETVRVEIAETDALLYGISETSVPLIKLRQEIGALRRMQAVARGLAGRLSARTPAGPDDAAAGQRRPARERRAAAEVAAQAEGLCGALERLEGSLSAGLDRVERELAQVRDKADRLRLLPASAVFPSLERAARDAAQTLGKRIAFETFGGESRLDAHVLAGLREALLHVVRNAVAHGIEAEPDRMASGKPALGRVELRVEQRGSRVAFVCRDDGRGIDVEGVRRAAVRGGLLSPAQAQTLTAEEVLPLVLRGGVTTSGSVTAVSGRGIGMDVLRETASRLKGDLRLTSEPGRGTAVEVVVPVSLSSQEALLAEAGGTAVWIPLDSVRRMLRVSANEIAHSAEGESLLLDGEVVPFLRLSEALRAQAAPTPNGRPLSVVVVQSGSALAAVGVERVRGTAGVVVRPLPALVEAAPFVTGATLDAEGLPQLALDPRGLVSAARAIRIPAAPAAAAPRSSVLVVDDSLTTRMLEQSILECAGYQVELATSGEEALAKAREGRYSLFLVDIEMPGMDGYEFVARTRSDPALRNTPAILVTSLGSPEHRRRGEEVGAHAYIVKSEFDQGRLLETIRELIG